VSAPRGPTGRPALFPVALTGTPGVGKSAVAAALRGEFRSVEVGELAGRLGAGRRAGRGWEVDLSRLRTALRRSGAFDGVDLVVGHLAHLLPVRRAIVLRCHPRELERRLARAHRGRAADRRANYVSEALDLVLAEALDGGVPVREIDTTGRRVPSVARDVRRALRERGPGRPGRHVDWLADPTVTAHLLETAG
jgi:adenylate kinase